MEFNNKYTISACALASNVSQLVRVLLVTSYEATSCSTTYNFRPFSIILSQLMSYSFIFKNDLR